MCVSACGDHSVQRSANSQLPLLCLWSFQEKEDFPLQTACFLSSSSHLQLKPITLETNSVGNAISPALTIEM